VIYTLTLNPSVDYIVMLEGFQIGQLNRTIMEAKYPGGKGINVSRVLKQFGINSKALGFVGGFTGDYIEQYLENEKITTGFVKVADDTRINVKLKTGQETEINANGPSISSENWQRLKEQIRNLNQDDFLILAGSIPATLPETTYEELVRICKENGAKFVVDAEGDLLTNVLQYRPFLIKPNHHELGELFDVVISTPEEVIPYAKKLIALGAQNVIVSLANQGAVFVNDTTVLMATVPDGEVKNSVGAGDSMVAGFLAEYLNTRSFSNAFRFSVASGSATAFSIGLCTIGMVNELLPQVQIKEIK
jgi:1-phosphofructokinase